MKALTHTTRRVSLPRAFTNQTLRVWSTLSPDAAVELTNSARFSPLSRTAGEGAERSEAGEGSSGPLRYSAAWGASG